jgi:murein DD-endopeptidase MepM/ murein hydrolase activator NlpD
VVYKTKDNGYGYSYVILAHANGYSTVYGHVSEILVEEGDQIVQGQILGLSGGMPGTKGAGYMTTGPHLHFELLKDGSHIDPLNYLPLNVFAVEDLKLLPEKYLRRIEL